MSQDFSYKTVDGHIGLRKSLTKKGSTHTPGQAFHQYGAQNIFHPALNIWRGTARAPNNPFGEKTPPQLCS